MAQTVTLHRGQVTLAASTSTILFTSTSSGTATRVIPGYLAWYSDFGTVYGYCTFGILRNGASSPNFSIIAATYPGTAVRQMSFSPHNTASGWHGQGTSNSEKVPVFTNGTINPTGVGAMTEGNSTMAWFNKNLIIGPSDAFYAAWADTGGGNRAAIIEYCFTLITES